MYYTNRLEKLKTAIIAETKPGGKLHLTKFNLYEEAEHLNDQKIDIPVTDPFKLIGVLKKEKRNMDLYFFEVYEAIEFYIEHLEEIEDKLVELNAFTRFMDEPLNYWFSELDDFRVKFHNIIVLSNYSNFLKYKDRLLVEKIQQEDQSEEKLTKVIQELEGRILFDCSKDDEDRINYFKEEKKKLKPSQKQTGNIINPPFLESTPDNYNWNLKAIEVAELCKALWETKRLIPDGMNQTALYKEMGAFFGTEVKYVSSTNQNLAKKKENELLNEMSDNLTKWKKSIQNKNPNK